MRFVGRRTSRPEALQTGGTWAIHDVLPLNRGLIVSVVVRDVDRFVGHVDMQDLSRMPDQFAFICVVAYQDAAAGNNVVLYRLVDIALSAGRQ